MTVPRLTPLLLSFSLMAACAGQDGGPPKALPDDLHGCPGSNPGIKPINIRYNGSTIEVHPDKKTDVSQGDVIRFNLVYTGNQDPEPEVLVSIAGKNAPSGWLNSSGKMKSGDPASTRFYVCVPTDLFDGEPATVVEKEYRYGVMAVDHEPLDPIVTVKK